MTLRRIALCVILSLAAGAECVADAPATYSFQEALDHGVVDFVANPWAHPDISADLDALARLKPGLINRLGFEYGGASAKHMDFSGDAAAQIHNTLPRTRIGGGLPENLKADYAASLPCDSEDDLRTFTRGGLTGKAFDSGNHYYWMDLGLKPAQDYYICIGKAQIRRHFTHLHFEEADNILSACAARSACVSGYRRVREELQRYAQGMGSLLSFSGEPKLAQEIELDAVYIPARFYINDFDQAYRSKVKTDVGNGYTYILSTQIVQDVLKQVPNKTHILFYVDNFDWSQDDLRRMMELDSSNRRELIQRSAEVAAKYGATFVPSFNHCDGCVPPNFLGDSCEDGADGKLTVYNARKCGDLDAIKEALAARQR